MNAPRELRLRGYQLEALRAISAQWAEVRATLLVLATGLGKTFVFADVLRRRKQAGRGRALILVHRDELVKQAAKACQAVGLTVDVEQAESRAQVAPTMMGERSDVVVASVPTLRAARLKRWPTGHFDTVIADEAHHATAKSWKRIIEHFGEAKVLGVTATPDRGDGVGLRAVFDSVCYEMGIREGVKQAFLVPIVAKQIECADLDISQVKSVRGDLSESELQQALTVDAVLHQIASALVKEVGDRPTVLFTTGVDAARAQAEILATYTDRGVAVVTGETPSFARQTIYDDFRDGRVQFLVNVAVLTEGWDAPHARCIAVARPTKSRALYTQVIGRGTRTAGGCIDHLSVAPTEERKAAIAASVKPDLLILDFVGNSGRHTLVGPLDALAGRPVSEKEREDAERKMAEGMDVETALSDAEAREAERQERAAKAAARRKARAEAVYRTRTVNVFGEVLGDLHAPSGGPRATTGQFEYLKKLGVPVQERPSIGEAKAMLDALTSRRKRGLCTYKQAALLAKYGEDVNVSFEQASAIITEIKDRGWRPRE